MKSRRPSMDGFIPRRTGSELGDLHSHEKVEESKNLVSSRLLHTGEGEGKTIGIANKSQLIGRSDIDESLKEIDDEPILNTKKLSRRQRRKLEKRNKKPVSRLKKTLRLFFLLVLIVILGAGGYLGMRIFLAGNSIFQGSIFDIIQSQKLKQDSNGRSNFLILGTSEDDPGHGGAYLTDSMMILSIDQTNKNAYMFSIPRDLYVQYGMACNSGYSGKINEFFNCVNDDYTTDSAEQQRMTETRTFIGKIFNLDIQYAIHVNNTVIKDAVNAVGGVDVDIQGSNGDSGILDRNFDWRCGYKCYLVKYDNGVHHLDGEHALFLAMARGDIAPTYGLANSNFDREKNQQKIIVALKNKAVSTGVITNLSTVTRLIDALGKNLRTNIEVKEIQTLMKLGSDIKTADIHSISLFDGDSRVVTTGNYNGASVVMPVAGIFDYSKIQDYIAQNLSSNPVVREHANITVLNGSGVVGAGQTESDKLEVAGFYVNSIDNAPSGTYDSNELYVLDSTKTATLSKLKSDYPNIVVKDGSLKYNTDNGTSFILIVGTANR